MEQKRPLRLELEIIINWFLLDCVASKKKNLLLWISLQLCPAVIYLYHCLKATLTGLCCLHGFVHEALVCEFLQIL